jgi:hypothetical protein
VIKPEAPIAERPSVEKVIKPAPVAKETPKEETSKEQTLIKAISLKDKLEQMKAAKAAKEADGDAKPAWKPKFKQ